MTPSKKTYDSEAELLKKVTFWLATQRHRGVYTMRIVDKYSKGYSDLFICVQGRLVVAELKDDTGTASPHQLKFIQEVRDAGGIGGVCRSVHEVATLVEEAFWREVK